MNLHLPVVGARIVATPQHRSLLVLGAFSLLVAAMFASFAPTPLYPLYDRAWQVGPLGISVAFAGYPVGVILVVLGVGGLSDRIGRQHTMLVAVGLLIAGPLVCSAVDSLVELALAWVIQGAGRGLAGSTAAATLADLHPRGASAGAWLHACGSTLGLGLGPLTSGWLAGRTAHPLAAPCLVIAGLAIVPATLLPAGRPRSGSGPRSSAVPASARVEGDLASLRRRLHLAARDQRMQRAVRCLSGRIAVAGLHSGSALTAGRLMSTLVAALGVGQLVSSRLGPWVGCRLGLLSIAAGLGTSAFAVTLHDAALAWGGCVVIGLGCGAAFLGSTRLIATHAPTSRGAETYGAWMLVGFVAMAAAALLSGSVLHGADVSRVLSWATVLAGVVAAAGVGVRRSPISCKGAT